MKFKNHVSISDKNEDPLKNEKRSLDKALMTGQQKLNRICTLQNHLTLKKKDKKKGTFMQKTGSNNHQRGQKASKKIISTRRPYSWTKEKCQSRQMTCHNPFKKEKHTEERRKPIKNPFQAL